MLRSLRARLILGFGLVIVLSLTLAGAGALFLLRDQQVEAAEARIGRLVDPLTQWVNQQQFVGAPPEYIASELVAYAGFEDVRVLLLDTSDTVVFDTDNSGGLMGEQIEGVGSVEQTAPSPGQDSYATTRFTAEDADGDLLLFAASRSAAVPVGWPSLAGPVTPVIAVPAEDVTAAWSALLPRLLLAGGVAAVLGVGISWLIADHITRPVHAMRVASERMAQGSYDQRVAVQGADEVAELGRSFNRMAERVSRSSRAMRELLANVSHELKTPLTSIQGFSQAIAEGVAGDPDEVRQLAEVVHEESERMRALVEDLLELSRLESGELALSFDEVDLDTVARDAARRLRFQAEKANVEFAFDLKGGPVVADTRRVEQVLANLIENAVRHSPAGGEVRITSRQESDAVMIAVHNGGTPIPRDDLPYIFDRFYQVDRVRTRELGHSGLGLAIVHELMQAHGGSVEVVSSPQEGTTFTVHFPRRKQNGRALRSRPAAGDLDGARAFGAQQPARVPGSTR